MQLLNQPWKHIWSNHHKDMLFHVPHSPLVVPKIHYLTPVLHPTFRQPHFQAPARLQDDFGNAPHNQPGPSVGAGAAVKLIGVQTPPVQMAFENHNGISTTKNMFLQMAVPQCCLRCMLAPVCAVDAFRVSNPWCFHSSLSNQQFQPMIFTYRNSTG